jgi:hypothetical protein
MNANKTPIEVFFDSYAHHTDKGNVQEIVACFADVFLAAGPQGAQPVRASDFALVVPKRIKLFESLGCRRTELISRDATWIDTRYVSVRTGWRLTFERPGAEASPIIVESTFLIDAGVEPFRILLYMAHADIMEVLKQRGIAPA